jgi:hypothetical protein
MIKANKIIDPGRVRALMAAMQPEGVLQDKAMAVKRNNRSKIESACMMIVKTSCSIPAAAQSWRVSTKSILAYAKANNIPVVHKPWELDAKAKAIIESGSHTQNIPRGFLVQYLLQYRKPRRRIKLHNFFVVCVCRTTTNLQ